MEDYDGDKLGKEIGEPVALKDVWRDEDSRTEGDIQAAIFTRLEGIRDTDYKWAPGSLREILDDVFKNCKFRDYFMEILDSRKIAKTKVHLPQARLPKWPILSPPPLVPTDSKKRKNRVQKDSPPREYRTKQQHRLIYREVGRPLSLARDIKTSFLAIKDTCIGVCVLLLAVTILCRAEPLGLKHSS